jgi:hypothetical protein
VNRGEVVLRFVTLGAFSQSQKAFVTLVVSVVLPSVRMFQRGQLYGIAVKFGILFTVKICE